MVNSAVIIANNGLLYARNQMAISLGWHIVLSCFGVAFPSMIWVVHRRAIAGDTASFELAKRWSKVAAVLFAIGAVSGTVLSFEMGILWPGLMGKYGDVLGLPFAVEGLAFFTEAIFLGIYIFGWGRLAPKTHLRTLVPVMISGVLGAYCVLAVNAWMNAPVGFDLDPKGKVINVRPLEVLFNSRAFGGFAHMWLGAFMLVGFVVAGVYARGLLKDRNDAIHRTGFIVAFGFASVAALIQPFVGHLIGGRLATEQPSKLAAMELSTHSQSRAPARIGGLLIDGKVRFAIELPLLGSLMTTDSINGTVPGLDDVAPQDRPNANLVHIAFQTMLGIGTGLLLLSLSFWVWIRRRSEKAQKPWPRWFLWGVVAAGPLAIVALEAGWVTTETGRQPWIIWQVMRVEQAAGSGQGLIWSLTAVVVIYGAMTVVSTRVLLSMSKRWRDGHELTSTYGDVK